jgi:predicted nucleic acid-binding protein
VHNNNPVVVYWDASAVLSALFKDKHSEEAINWSHREGVHLISSLSCAEVYAVISRIRREGLLADVLINAAYESLEEGPWRRLYLMPDWDGFKALSQKWPLRGADLWHLTTAKTLQKRIPESYLLTFDNRLMAAAMGEGLHGGAIRGTPY